MANNNLWSIHQDKAFHVLGLFCLMLLMQRSNAAQFTVGGAKGWTVPDNSTAATNYNQWAEYNRFQIGDTLLFVYKSDQDSVLEVSKENYGTCNTTNPINKYNDGHTVFTFNHSGPHYFISGNKDNCDKGEKLVIIVLADRNKHNAASPPSPTTETAPSPAPTGEETPPSETPPPAQPKNAASSLFASFIGSIGAFFASSLILVF